MPNSAVRLFQSANVALKGTVPWGGPIPTQSSGVYVVSLCSDAAEIGSNCPLPQIDENAVREWLSRASKFELDGQSSPSVEAIVARLRSFWLADENIIYIGKATSLRNRVRGYYSTPLGEPKPHAGGHWIKTLANLGSTHVHFAEASEFADREAAMLSAFIDGVSQATRQSLADPARPFPFANLEYPPGTRKRHGMSHQRRGR